MTQARRAQVCLVSACSVSAPAVPRADHGLGQGDPESRDGKERADASNAVVWIEGATHSGPGPRSAKRREMKSASKRFQPRVVAVSKNATVEFPNADPIYHNVFSVSGANRFDLGLYRSGASKSKTFEEAGSRARLLQHPSADGRLRDGRRLRLRRGHRPGRRFPVRNVPAGHATS